MLAEGSGADAVVEAHVSVVAKSLRSYIDRFHPDATLRFSLARYREQEDMITVPLYAIGPWLRADRRVLTVRATPAE